MGVNHEADALHEAWEQPYNDLRREWEMLRWPFLKYCYTLQHFSNEGMQY